MIYLDDPRHPAYAWHKAAKVSPCKLTGGIGSNWLQGPCTARSDHGRSVQTDLGGIDQPAFYNLIDVQCWHPTPYPRGGGQWRDCNTPRPQKPKAAPKADALPPPQPPADAPATSAPEKPASPAVPAPVPAHQNRADLSAAPQETTVGIAQLNGLSGDLFNGPYAIYSEITLATFGLVVSVLALRQAVVIHAYWAHTIEQRMILAAQRMRAAIVKTYADIEAADAERKRQAEWKRYERMRPARFAAEIRRRQDRITRLHDWAVRIEDQAERVEASGYRIPLFTRWRIDHLRQVSEKYAATALAEFDEVERIRSLYADIEAARIVKGRDKAWADVRCMLGLLSSKSDAAARSALRKLNRHRDFEWLAVLPHDLTGSARAQAVKLLSLITGTDNINEARNALARLLGLVGPHWLT
ncbi:hypothetical protein [Bradyrhizobium sp. STM 3809]|uniref:hypothetical protein n=1 Tax=Bradyrhizobium sp. STM 3809 TaxID=551936 RepID=UPI0002406541|nr:hypothetical protein [Bradyrhizobium sp. STM 3809]CCD97621.1 hypothetical protein BRAS3809_1160003 [Bradyrhizobium sp. STM 3809]